MPPDTEHFADVHAASTNVGDDCYPVRTSSGATLPIYSDERVAALDKNSPPSVLTAVRHLFFDPTDGRDGWILAACSNVHNLSLMATDTAWIPLIARLPLKHLYTPEFIPGPTFAHLTHLEIYHPNRDISPWLEELGSLPRLTHLWINDRRCAIFSQLLRTCAGLQVLVGRQPLGEEDTTELAQDPRFVVTGCANYIEDWYMGARWGEDYWHRAEIFVAKRRAREIDPLKFEMADESPAFLPM
ncbi:hypothetical protein B0H16DRAFT_1888418 [Mycena metata]|uniref:Uncharacterized protein n=1 Tax=Mycena metata TaxID=1033252 RepID=A0AAD7N7C5_9AGAR|nr:hypothetical protein B0H16DRAFT_1888418 [Mycena metata]